MNRKDFLKYFLALLLNTFPFFIGCFQYQFGSAVMEMFFLLQIILNTINYRWAKNLISYVLLNLAMLISSIIGNITLTKMYYNNISADSGTLAVGDFAVTFAFVFIVFMTIASIFYKKISKNIKEQSDQRS